MENNRCTKCGVDKRVVRAGILCINDTTHSFPTGEEGICLACEVEDRRKQGRKLTLLRKEDETHTCGKPTPPTECKFMECEISWGGDCYCCGKCGKVYTLQANLLEEEKQKMLKARKLILNHSAWIPKEVVARLLDVLSTNKE